MADDSRHIERLRGVVKFLDNTSRNVLLYPAAHPSVHAPSKRMREYMDELFREKEEFLLGIINEVLYLDDYFFYEPTPWSREIQNALARFKVENIVLRRGFSEAEGIGLARALKGKGEGREDFARLLAENGVVHAQVKDFTLGADEDLPTKSLESYRSAVSAVSRVFRQLHEGQMPPLREAEGTLDRFLDLLPAHRTMLMVLSSLKGYDTYTFQHSVNVGILSLLLGEARGFSGSRLRAVSLAGLLHDVGKVRIPDSVLHKPGRLSGPEWEMMRLHSTWSGEIAEGMGAAPEVVEAVYEHHCWAEGGGYPVLPASRQPGEMARIIAVADCYDAMTTVRPYQDPLHPGQAMGILDKLKTAQLDPVYVDSFRGMMGLYPPGCLVRLSGNEIAEVVAAGSSAGRPAVRLVLDRTGLPFMRPVEVDLGKPEHAGWLVAGVVDPVLYGVEPSGQAMAKP